MDFIDTAREVIKLASSYKTREANREGRTPLQMLLSAPPDPAEKYLKSLPEDEVMKLQTLMYWGRYGGDIRQIHDYLVTVTPDKKDAIGTMTAKVPLSDYLQQGIDRAAGQGIDLEGRF